MVSTKPGVKMEAFPESFTMIAGDASRKANDASTNELMAVMYHCERNFGNGTVRGYTSYSLPKEGCSVITTKVWFPSCWDGKAFDGRNTKDHVKYPVWGGGLFGAECPKGRWSLQLTSDPLNMLLQALNVASLASSSKPSTYNLVDLDTAPQAINGEETDRELLPSLCLQGLTLKCRNGVRNQPTYILANGDTTGYGLQ